jgi:predicted mannosyl-3-phosphoglycerate phosphatase (HAD superfamily)
MPEGCSERDGFWVREFSPPRSRWTPVLDALRERFAGCFEDFATAGDARIAAMTGLSLERAALANRREYSEPVQWQGGERELEEFLDALRAAGAHVLRGGRFYSVGGDCDKGRAWLWLRDVYALAAGSAAVYDLGLGDGANDVPLLEVTHRAVRIPARSRPLPALERSEGVLAAEGEGPAAWASGVREWLRERYADVT